MSVLMKRRTTNSSLLVFWILLLSESYAFIVHHSSSRSNWPRTKCLGAIPKHYHCKSFSTSSCLRQTCLLAKKGKTHEDEDTDKVGDESSSYYVDLFSNRNQAIWGKRMEQLKDYKEKYGTVNVSYSNKDYTDLYGFIQCVRLRQTRVNAEQRAHLDALGFIWIESDIEKFDRKWEEKFIRLKEYQSVHGHCDVPVVFPDDQKLSKWARNQRIYYWDCQSLRKDRAEKLESIGFDWKHKPIPRNPGLTQEQRWFRSYESLREFVQENGHFEVSRSDNTTKVLGQWVKTQRTNFRLKKLRKDRMELLNEIGFPWSTKPKYDTIWKQSYDHYKEYLHKENGRTKLPQKLSKWLHIQRLGNEKGSLAPEKKALLDELGFVWTPFVVAKQGERSLLEDVWHRRYKELVEFHSMHNHFRVPASGETKSVHHWLNNQRKCYRQGTLPQNRIDMLNEIGFSWDPKRVRAIGSHD